MKAEFTMHINITDRNVVLTTDTNNMQGVDTQLAINIWKSLEGTRTRIKQQIDKYYGDDTTAAPETKQETDGEGAQQENEAPAEAGEGV